ncbi:hypothetical protein L1W93_19025 [Acinetobacter baumannii]|jgi:hypothetical protein|nr:MULTISPECIES: hypothetical protein [Gammaproteobacteria]EKW0402820.1 hypothetical protein [Proteus mirabilis]PXA50595.1 hypothetical protein DMB35_15175 [Acinetobacter baumannii A424]ARG30280.1 hypothetical protein B7L41_03210 [Acinetobacter baumannii]ATT08036.1 hypothetical protein BTN68_23955 [Salmonella enterica subsp. enterica serovar Enteritidis]AVN16105.1 hypothetical protein C6N18_19215 [Acinetobacter baumannii]
MRTAIGVALVSMTLLAGCGGSAGDQFLGKWVGVKNDKHVLEIERNGDSYMVRNTEPSPFTGKTRTTNLPATLQDDVLQVSVGFGAISLAIDGKSGNLTDGRMEYRRQE